MDEENGAQHDNDDGCRADPEQSAEQDGEAAGELCEADEIADDCESLHEGGECNRARTAVHAEEDGGAVVEKRKGAGEAHDQEFEVEFASGAEGELAGSAHSCCLSSLGVGG